MKFYSLFIFVISLIGLDNFCMESQNTQIIPYFTKVGRFYYFCNRCSVTSRCVDDARKHAVTHMAQEWPTVDVADDSYEALSVQKKMSIARILNSESEAVEVGEKNGTPMSIQSILNH